MNKQIFTTVSLSSLVSSSSDGSSGMGNQHNTYPSECTPMTRMNKIDRELRCPICHQYFCYPLILPCGHSICSSCAASTLLPSTDPSISSALNCLHNNVNLNEYLSSNMFNHNSTHSVSTGSSDSNTAGSYHSQPTTNNPVILHTTYIQPTPSNSSHSDSDQQSVVSESDSGVVMSSRPISFSGRGPMIFCYRTPTSNPSLTHGISLASIISYGINCPTCKRVVGLFDDVGLGHLKRNRALERVIYKFINPELLRKSEGQRAQNEIQSILAPTDPLNHPGGPLCQLCEEPTGSNKTQTSIASAWCDHCEIFYCSECRERCHPSKGPFLRHRLHSASKGVDILRERRQNQPTPCSSHPCVLNHLYCVTCHTVVCQECLMTEGNPINEIHTKHDLQSLGPICKAKKTDLSQALQSLSEKARNGTEHIQRLRHTIENNNLKMIESEQLVKEQLDALLVELENKKSELLTKMRSNRENNLVRMKEQIGHVTSMLTRSTGLIQFCIEILKETDHTAFLLVAQPLILRTQETEERFVHELAQASLLTNPNVALSNYQIQKNPQRRLSSASENGFMSSILSIQLSAIESIKLAIDRLSLQEVQNIKPEACDQLQSLSPKSEVPAPPKFLTDECISGRNIITLVWKPTSLIHIDRYLLELDDGANGHFRKVYRGKESICTVEGLHFHSSYRARVKAHNSAGESLYSAYLCFQTSDLTWFHLDSSTMPYGILLTNNNRTITSQYADDRVILGSTGLSRGVHYWEFTVDRCDPGGQPAFGIARADCNKEIMLGFDMYSWSVYFDQKRSWFLHNGEHFERTEGGVRAGSVVGVRLDCNRGSLSYYLNDEPHGPIAFTNLPNALYYPAISMNRTVQLTLHSGLEAPSESEEDDEADGEGSSGGEAATETTSMATAVLVQPSAKPRSD